MAKQLLFNQGGGGVPVDYSAPDVTLKRTLNANSSVTIDIQKKPRYVYFASSNTSNQYMGVTVLDYDNDKGYTVSNTSAGDRVTTPSEFTTITLTDTTLTLKNQTSNQYAYCLMAWY